MVNHSIKVFARLKREDNVGEKGIYEIVQRKVKYDDIIFYSPSIQQGNTPYSFRKVNKSIKININKFHKVFDQHCNQEDVFNIIAKPVINSVLQGFNGTIFAYGQTGSGKTYTITGSPKNYHERGIIPRSIQYIFGENEKLSAKPTIYISYMEIYNEVGYDLLSQRQNNTARSLEDLPRIALLEDGKGEAHIRNLSVLPVTTEQEAMRLLFLGDTNRTIAETPMNEYSSRSHCIFTIYITFRNEPTNIIRFSKLHLVDLAGSERVSKSLTTGTALNEAKHINLSLHYLQQVILALSESKRSHIPYRNSMMTYLLKDSLSGNCLTAMLATLSVSKYNVQETLSTCKFAQRVSLISTEPVINEICDPHQEIVFLKNKIEELRKQISVLTGFTASTKLTPSEEDQCRKEVDKYLNNDDSSEELKVKSDLRQIQYCFKLLKSKINNHFKETEVHKLEYDKSQKELSILKEAVDKKEAEITTLRTIIDNIPENPVNPVKSQRKFQHSFDPTPESVTIQTSIDNVLKRCRQDADTSITKEDEKHMFEKFMMNPENAKDINYYTHNLEKKWRMAKIYADTIEQCQKNIIYVRQKLQMCSDITVKNQLLHELEDQQNIYRKSLADLKTVKNETDHLQSGLRQAEFKTMQKFKSWLEDEKASKNGNFLTEICWSEATHKPCGTNKEPVKGCCSNNCNCRTNNCKADKLSMNCASSFCHHEEYCTKPNISHYHKLQNNACNKPDWCCRKDSICDMRSSHNLHNYPYIFHPSHSELGPMKQDLPGPNHGKSDDHMGFQRKEMPVCESCSCRQVNSDMLYDSCSSGFLDSIDILIEEVEKNDAKHHEKNREKCQHNVDRNKHTKVCCQLFCCNNLNRGNIFLSNNKPKPSEYAPVRKSHSCCNHDTLTFVPNINSTEFEHSSEDDTAFEHFSSCCKDFVNEPKIRNSEEVVTREDCDHDCDVQTELEPEIVEKVEVVAEVKVNNENSKLFKQTDSAEFREFMKTVPLTGEGDIDEEIFNFYRSKFCA